MTAEVHTLAGPYAVHALPIDEQLFFERHLDACEACRVEVDELEATAAVLGAMWGQAPPPSMREQVLARVDVVRQLPPRARAEVPARAPTGRRRGEWLLAGVAGVLAAALVVVSGVAVNRGEPVAGPGDTAPGVVADDRALAVLAAADAETRLLRAEGQVSARFVYSPELDAGLFVAHGMEPLAGGTTYELWLYHDGTPQPATVFDTDDEGRAFVVVEGSVTGAEFAAVTVEPQGGSPQPTGQVVAHGSVS